MATLLIQVGCAPDSSTPSISELTDSAGVAIWSLGSNPVEAGLSLERVGEVSLPDSGWVVESDGVTVDRAGGRVYVLDELGPRLLVFTLEGALIGELGRPGEGPGEFEMPVAVDVDPEGVVWVVDASRSLLLTWDRQGAFLGQERLPVPYWGPGFQVSGGAVLYVRGDEGRETRNFSEVLTRLSDGSASDLVRLRQEWVEVSSGCGSMPLPKPMTASIVWNANDRYAAAVQWPEYSIQVFEAGRIVAILRRNIPPVPILEDQALNAVAAGPLGFLIETCGMTKAEVLRAAGFVDVASPVDRMVVDPLDRIWTRVRAAPDDPGHLEVLDLDNGYLGSLSTPVLPVAFISEERFLAISDHDWGSSVEIWRVRGRPRTGRG
jgi:hypothetical protein